MDNFEITNINAAEGENVINAEITNETEYLIAAHNASPEAHSELKKNVDEISEQLSSLKSNMLLESQIPTKLSDLENDKEFVSEQSLINALELRQIVNLSTVETKVGEALNEANTMTETLFSNLQLNKAGINATNFTDEGKDNIVNFLQLDYSRMYKLSIAQETVSIAPTSGILLGRGAATQGGAGCYLFVTVLNPENTSQGLYMFMASVTQLSGAYTSTLIAPLEKGTYFKWGQNRINFPADSGFNKFGLYFIPLKGAQ